MPHAPVLGDLATPVTVIGADTGVGEIEAMIRAHPESLGVVAVDGETPYVLDRPYLEKLGRRLLHDMQGPGFDVLQGHHFGRPAPSRETTPKAA